MPGAGAVVSGGEGGSNSQGELSSREKAPGSTSVLAATVHTPSTCVLFYKHVICRFNQSKPAKLFAKSTESYFLNLASPRVL